MSMKVSKQLQSMFDEISAQKSVVKNMLYKYSFGSIVNGQVRIFVTVEYEVENLSDSILEYSPNLQIEENDKPEILQASYHFGKVKNIISGKDALVKSDRRGVIKAIGCKTTIEPNTEGHTFAWHYSMSKNASDNDMIAFGCQTMGIRILSQHDLNVFSVVVDDEYKLIKLDDYTWETPKMFFGGQHIRIRWFAK